MCTKTAQKPAQITKGPSPTLQYLNYIDLCLAAHRETLSFYQSLDCNSFSDVNYRSKVREDFKKSSRVLDWLTKTVEEARDQNLSSTDAHQLFINKKIAAIEALKDQIKVFVERALN